MPKWCSECQGTVSVVLSHLGQQYLVQYLAKESAAWALWSSGLLGPPRQCSGGSRAVPTGGKEVLRIELRSVVYKAST